MWNDRTHCAAPKQATGIFGDQHLIATLVESTHEVIQGVSLAYLVAYLRRPHFLVDQPPAAARYCRF